MDQIDYFPTASLDAGMSISRSMAEFLEATCAEFKPAVSVDVGTGNGSSLCALARQAPLGGVVWTVDSQEQFLERGRAQLSRITHQADVHFILAPLLKNGTNKSRWWYNPVPLENVQGPINLLFVDGPEGFYDRGAALPCFLDRLAPNARIYLDDFKRPGEQAAFKRWKDLLTKRSIPFSACHLEVARGVGEIVIRKG